jgi:hypothetical protein
VDNFTDSSLLSQATNIDSGNVPGGLFWTIPIPPESATINLGDGKASLELANLELLDFGNFCNDAVHGPSVASTVSLKAQWSGVIKRAKVRNTAEGFGGQFLITNASLEYSASTPDNNFEFVSDPASASTNVFAQIGREHNGVFFPEGNN